MMEEELIMPQRQARSSRARRRQEQAAGGKDSTIPSSITGFYSPAGEGKALEEEHNASVLPHLAQDTSHVVTTTGIDAVPTADPAVSRTTELYTHEGQPSSSAALQEYRSGAVGTSKFEYLDHTADIQLHAWGDTLAEAFENVALAMYNYMTPIAGVAVDDSLTRHFNAEGHDLQSLLFNFLDELLFVFATDFFVCCKISVEDLDTQTWRIKAKGWGETFDRTRHEIGTEIKAITYSAMQIHQDPGNHEVFVIVDI